MGKVISVEFKVGNIHFHQLWHSIQKQQEERTKFEFFGTEFARCCVELVGGSKYWAHCVRPLRSLWLLLHLHFSRFGFKDLMLTQEIMAIVIPFFMD